MQQPCYQKAIKPVGSKTKKKSHARNELDKAKLWAIYDNDKNLQENEDMNVVEQTEFCMKCQNLMIISVEGFPVCQNKQCGYMSSYSLDYSPEWRFFGNDQKGNNTDTTRCGNPIDPLLEESSYACKIMCNHSASSEMRNLKKWSRWQSMPHKEKMLHEEFQLISVYATNGGIPKVFIDEAKIIYKDLYEQKNFRGLKRDAMRAACIWISCWKMNNPRTPNEIAEIFHIDKNSATLGCSVAESLLKSHERTLEESERSQLCTLKPDSFIERFCSKVDFNQEQTLLSKFVCMKVQKKKLITDNRPQAISAGIVYFINFYCNLGLSKMDVKTKLGDEASEVTINKCFKKLKEYKTELLPSWVFDKYKVYD